MDIAEKHIQKAILQYLWMRGYVFKRNNSGLMLGEHKGKKWAIHIGEKGWPDTIGMTKPTGKPCPTCGTDGGRFVGIECKNQKGLVTLEQNAMIQRINKSGGMAFVARSVDEVIERGL